jgi:hypothetical protein
MANRFTVFRGDEIVTVEPEIEVTPKGYQVKQQKLKVPARPVRAGQKKRKHTARPAQHETPRSGCAQNSLTEQPNYWSDDPPLCVFDPEPESMFTKSTKVSAGSHLLFHLMMVLPVRHNMIIWRSGYLADLCICSH